MSQDIEARDINLIFMGRMVERYIGEKGLERLIETKHENLRENWADIGSERETKEPEYLLRLFTDEVHEYEVVQNKSDCLEVIVTECRHAQIFKNYNAADLGEKLICSSDFAVVEGYNPDMVLERPDTCMTGECCHFKFTLPSE